MRKKKKKMRKRKKEKKERKIVCMRKNMSICKNKIK
jgi:hypothetical protein